MVLAQLEPTKVASLQKYNPKRGHLSLG